MPPKKKDSEASVPSASLSPPPEQTGGGVDAGGRMGVDEGALSAAKSKDKAAQTSASMRAPRPSQEARDQQRHGVRSAIRPLTQDQAGVHASLERHANHQLDLGSADVWRCERYDTAGPAPLERDAVRAWTPRSVPPCPWTWQRCGHPRRRPFLRRRPLHHPFAPEAVEATRTEQLPPNSSSSVACR